MVTKFGQFKKLKFPNFVNCPNFVTIFCRVLGPYFFVVENIQNHKFFWKNLLFNEFWTAMGGGLLGILKKNISIFKTWHKMVTKFGQFKKLKCPNFVNCPTLLPFFVASWDPSHLFSFAFFVVVENIQNCQFFWKNWLVNEFRTAMGGG